MAGPDSTESEPELVRDYRTGRSTTTAGTWRRRSRTWRGGGATAIGRWCSTPGTGRPSGWSRRWGSATCRRGWSRRSRPADPTASSRSPAARSPVVSSTTTNRIALLTGEDISGQRASTRDMRKMPARRKQQIDPLELSAGDYVVHEQHGVGRFVEMKQREVQGATREYLVLEYGPSKRGGPPDRLFVPADALDQVTRYVGGEQPSLDRLGGGDWAKRKGRARKAVREIAAELIKLYAARQATKGFAFGPDTPVAARARGRVPVHRDARPADHRRRGEVGHAADGADGPAGLRRRRLRQDRDRGAGGVQGGAGRQAGGRAGADHAAGHPAPQHLHRADERLPGGREGAEPLPDRQGGPRGHRRPGRGQHRHRGRHPPAAQPRHQDQGPRPDHRRRGAAVRRRAQGADEAAPHQRRRAEHERHPDPAHPGDGGHRHPRDVDDHHPARGTAPGAHLRRRLRGPPGHRRRTPGAAARRPGLLHPQPGAVDREGRGQDPRAGARRPGGGGARADGGAPAGAGDARLLGEAVRRARLHHDRGVRASTSPTPTR